MSEQPSVFHLLPSQVTITMLRDTPGEELDHKSLSVCVTSTLFVLLQQERWKNRSTLAELNCTQLQTPNGGTGWFVWNPCDLRVDHGQRLSCSPIVGGQRKWGMTPLPLHRDTSRIMETLHQAAFIAAPFTEAAAVASLTFGPLRVSALISINVCLGIFLLSFHSY